MAGERARPARALPRRGAGDAPGRCGRHRGRVRARGARGQPRSGRLRVDEGRADARRADARARGWRRRHPRERGRPGLRARSQHGADVRAHGGARGHHTGDRAAGHRRRHRAAPVAGSRRRRRCGGLPRVRARPFDHGPDARRERRTVDGLVSDRDRVFYSSSVHDDREIDAVVEVLRSGPQGLWPGRRVVKMEREVAARFGKAHGVMCNSGSSALYLALELLDLPRGAEVVTCALTFSTDVAPIVRGGWGPAFVDCEPLTYCVDVDRIEEMINERTGALLFPNLIGNAPDWDRIADIAARHDLPIIEDSCDTLGATLRGTPTGERSTISVTSFANSHIITCAGNGGMVMTDREDLRDRAVMLRRWGRRSELHYFGSKRGRHDFWEQLDGIHYDNQFIFDELAWNFEPSELGAAFGLVQLEKLPGNLARRRRHFARYSDPLAGRA